VVTAAGGLLALALALVSPTDYDRELARLDQGIAELRDTAFREPIVFEKATRYIGLVYRRSSLTGDFADFRAAETTIEQGLQHLGPLQDLYLLQAQLDFKLHRLAAARDDLTRTPDLAGHPDVAALQVDLALQEGRYEVARQGYERLVRENRTWDNLARLAYYRGKTGDVAAADQLYAEAQDELSAKEMRSFAWVELQRGLLDLDGGRDAQALAHYQRADRAYSGYWLIEEHLAEVLGRLGRTDEAIARYRRVVEKTHNPEFLSALARLLESRDPRAAAELDREAERRFEEQSSLYPEAAIGHFLQHLLSRKEAGPQLLALAQRNVELRPNAESKLLLALAYWKLRQPGNARALVAEIRATPWRTPEITRFVREVSR
jgi:tetratricopeptide (TPR) repeat protein